jgi:hypothetical protein
MLSIAEEGMARGQLKRQIAVEELKRARMDTQSRQNALDEETDWQHKTRRLAGTVGEVVGAVAPMVGGAVKLGLDLFDRKQKEEHWKADREDKLASAKTKQTFKDTEAERKWKLDHAKDVRENAESQNKYTLDLSKHQHEAAKTKWQQEQDARAAKFGRKKDNRKYNEDVKASEHSRKKDDRKHDEDVKAAEYGRKKDDRKHDEDVKLADYKRKKGDRKHESEEAARLWRQGTEDDKLEHNKSQDRLEEQRKFMQAQTDDDLKHTKDIRENKDQEQKHKIEDMEQKRKNEDHLIEIAKSQMNLKEKMEEVKAFMAMHSKDELVAEAELKAKQIKNDLEKKKGEMTWAQIAQYGVVAGSGVGLLVGFILTCFPATAPCGAGLMGFSGPVLKGSLATIGVVQGVTKAADAIGLGKPA